jgi:hypothetical protein
VPVASWGSYSFLYGPAIALVAVALLVLLLRWTFRRGGSLVERTPRRGPASDYGLLVPVAAPATFAEAELIRARLVGHGVRATLAPTTDGPRVLVFREEAAVARALLRTW